MHFKLGVSSLLFKHESLEKALYFLIKTKHRVIDLVFAPPSFCPHYNPLTSKKEDDLKLKELLESYPFKIASLNIVPGKINIGDTQKTVDFILKSVKLCRLLEVPILTIPSGAKVRESDWLKNVKYIGEKLSDIINFAKDCNVTISVEAPHINTITETVEEVIRFVDVVNLTDLKLTFDTSHAQTSSEKDITESFQRIGKENINHIHIRDAINHSTNLTPGTGACNFKKFFLYLKQINYQKYVIYELEYHGFSNEKILNELAFAEGYINSIIDNKKLSLSYRVKTDKRYNILKRFLEQPKVELTRHHKLFNLVSFFVTPLLKLRPEKVFEGKYKLRLRPFKGKITNLKKDSIFISSIKKINVGIVGLGAVGFRWHAVGLNSVKGVNLVGGYDIDSDKNSLFSKKFNTKVCATVNELLERDVDLLVICTSEDQHYNLIKLALKSGIDVFCEKILTTKISDSEEVVKLACERNKFLAVNYNYHYLPGIIKIKELIDNGKLGYLSYLNIIVHSSAYAHAIDLVRFLGQKITSVCAIVREDEKLKNPMINWSKFDESIQYLPSRATSVSFTYNNGSYAVINSTNLYDLNKMIISVEAVFEKDVLILNGINMYNCIGSLTNSSGRKSDYDLDINKRIYTKRFGYTFFESIKDTLACYTKGQKPPTSGKQALYNLELERFIFESAQKHETVEL